MTDKMRTITMTDRPPVTIREDEWPIYATGDANDDDSDGRGNDPNREWTRTIRVRRHADGRVIVYGIYSYDTAFQGAKSAAAKRGVLLTGPTLDIIAAIRDVADSLATAEADADIDDARRDPAQWRQAAQCCIADLPAERL